MNALTLIAVTVIWMVH